MAIILAKTFLTLKCNNSTPFVLGDVTQIEMILFVSGHPRWPKQEGCKQSELIKTTLVIVYILDNVNTALKVYLHWRK